MKRNPTKDAEYSLQVLLLRLHVAVGPEVPKLKGHVRLFPLTLNTVRKISDGSKYIRSAEGFFIFSTFYLFSMHERRPHVQPLVAVEPVIAVIAAAAVVVAVAVAPAPAAGAAVVMREGGVIAAAVIVSCAIEHRLQVLQHGKPAWLMYILGRLTSKQAERVCDGRLLTVRRALSASH